MSQANVNCLLTYATSTTWNNESTKPTRISDPARNILDLMLTSNPNYISKCVVDAGISDHEIVMQNH